MSEKRAESSRQMAAVLTGRARARVSMWRSSSALWTARTTAFAASKGGAGDDDAAEDSALYSAWR